MNQDIFILLGTNLGNRIINLTDAKKNISLQIGPIVKESKIYETAAWGITEQPSFLNQVLQIETQLAPENLLKKILLIEKNMGRIRKQKWGERLIDIDILYYSHEIINQEKLTIPHPYLHERRFTLVPLAEIAPKFVHPILLKTSHVLLELCRDVSEVNAVIPI